MSWLRAHFFKLIALLAKAMVLFAYLKGRSDAHKRRDADEMTDAYMRERTRDEIDRNVARDGNARDRLRADWQRRN